MPNDADPHGDLLLRIDCNDKQVAVHVSSKILSLASPVFKAMLSVKFAEGQGSKDTDWTISLPDNDADAMTIVCHTLHYADTDSDDVDLTLLEKVAEVCDKYNMAKAIRGWSESALLKWRLAVDIDETLYTKLLYVSYVLESQETFWAVSRGLMYYCRVAPSRDTKIDLSFATVPESLLSKLDRSLIIFLSIAGNDADNCICLGFIKTERSDIMFCIQRQVELIIDRYLGQADKKNHNTV